jgi:hypothetical protein
VSFGGRTAPECLKFRDSTNAERSGFIVNQSVLRWQEVQANAG